MALIHNHPHMPCANCHGPATPDTSVVLASCSDGLLRFICSPSCLVEWAWKLKDAQTKLSKSTQS
jgi:hypothetical protein